MKDLVESGGFDKDNMKELQMINKIIENCNGEFLEYKNSMSKCLELLINFSNQYLETYKTSQEENNEVSYEDKLN